MNFMDPDKTYMLIVGGFIFLCFGGAIMGMIVTSETRSSTGRGGTWYIVGAILAATIGWMAIDYVWFPANKTKPIPQYVQEWLKSKF